MQQIRLASPNDYRSIFSIYKPFVEMTAISFETELPSINEFGLRITQILTNYPWLVAELEGNIIGYAYACKHRHRSAYLWSVETSVYIKHTFERKGIATGLYTALFEILKIQGYKTALAGITMPNEKSVEFHKSFGFSSIGVFDHIGYKANAWHSTSWWQRPISNYNDSPKKPLIMKEIAGTSQFLSALKLGMEQFKIPL